MPLMMPTALVFLTAALIVAGAAGARGEPRPLLLTPGDRPTATTAPAVAPMLPGHAEAIENLDRGKAASMQDFLDRFGGDWRGGGFVIRDAGGPRRRVACSAVGVTGEATVDVVGDCRALAIFRRDIGVKLSADADLLTGIYIGSSIGDARLEGGVEDGMVVMTMEWPEPVNGDMTARMEIVNDGDGKLLLKVVDKVDGANADSETFVSTDLTLERRAEP